MPSPLPEELGAQLYGHDGSEKRRVKTDADGALLTTPTVAVMPGFNIPPYDRIEASYPDTVTEIYVYKKSGSTVATITVVYTDATKTFISTADKT